MTTLVSEYEETVGFHAINFTYPGPGRLLHFSSAIAPRKSREEVDDYMMTSLWFIEDEQAWFNRMQGQLVPYWQNFTFECRFGTEVLQSFTRRQGRGEYLQVECPLPDAISRAMRQDAPEGERAKAFQAFQSHIDTSIVVRFDGVDAQGNDARDSILIGEQRLVFEAPAERAYLGACISPVRFGEDIDLRDMIEWRVYHQQQGMRSVHWYGREKRMAQWVKRLNQRLDVQDTFRYAPIVNAPINPYFPYHDQALWYADCFLRAGFTTEWLAIIDVDEYLTPIGELGSTITQNTVVDYFKGLAPHYASVSMWQSYWGGGITAGAPDLKSFPAFPRNARTLWTDAYKIGGLVRYTKTIHRTRGVYDLWVHAVASLVWDYWGMTEEDNMTILHARKSMYKDIHLEYPVNVTQADYTFWNIMKDKLQGLDDLAIL